MEKTNIFKPLYVSNHTPVGGHFSKNSSDFVVREAPLYEFSGNGEHSVIEIQKKDLTTFEALQILSEFLGIKIKEFGYAGLKDKQGMTTQFISFPSKFEHALFKFEHEKIKILNVTRHNNKLKIGHLKGNSFFIRLKKILEPDALKLQQVISYIDKNGFANYFGYQRFGKFKDNAKQGEKILYNELKIKNPKIKNFLISAYQSDLFNKWLSKRVEISKFAMEFNLKEFGEIYGFSKDEAKIIYSQKQFYKILPGEILGHYPFGKFFICKDLDVEVKRFINRDITSCGILIGNKNLQSSMFAKKFEDEIYNESYKFMSQMMGSLRFAWCYLKDLSYSYNKESAQFGISFFLPKGSYATVVLEEILHRDIFEDLEV